MITKISKYGSRNWAVTTVSGELIAVTVYRKGARRVAELLGQLPEAGDFKIPETAIADSNFLPENLTKQFSISSPEIYPKNHR